MQLCFIMISFKLAHRSGRSIMQPTRPNENNDKICVDESKETFLFYCMKMRDHTSQNGVS